MNEKICARIASAATAIELCLGLLIFVLCVVSAVGIAFFTDIGLLLADPDYLQARLSDACLVIIGIELIKMITSYTIDSVVDVMLLSVARQMIVEHTAPMENLLAVFAVGILFVIRKYLYISQIDGRQAQCGHTARAEGLSRRGRIWKRLQTRKTRAAHAAADQGQALAQE